MKQKILTLTLLMLAALLSACSWNNAEQPSLMLAAESETSAPAAPAQMAKWNTAMDEQGSVSVAVTPVDLSVDAASLDFEVVLDTHSVDLGMDLATLSTVLTDTGQSISATHWDAVPGGHHVTGVLSFPATANGTAFLEGASKLTLTIRDVDAPERTFVWPLTH